MSSAYVSVWEVIECLESESDLELEQNKSPTKTEALHSLQMIRNYLTSISETTDIDCNSLHNNKKSIAGSYLGISKRSCIKISCHNKKVNHQKFDFYFFRMK